MFKTFLLHSVYSGFPQKMWTILRCENENVKKKSIERSWKIVCIIIYYMWGHLTIQVVLTHSFSMYVSAYICWGHRNNAALKAYLWKGKGFHKAVENGEKMCVNTSAREERGRYSDTEADTPLQPMEDTTAEQVFSYILERDCTGNSFSLQTTERNTAHPLSI